MDQRNIDSTNREACQLIVKRIGKAELKKETVNIVFEVIVANGVVKWVKYKTQIERKYDKLENNG